VTDDDELMLITQQGKILRMDVRDTRPIGRATQGVRLIEIDEQDRVVSVARLAEKDENGKDEAGGAGGPVPSAAEPEPERPGDAPRVDDPIG